MSTPHTLVSGGAGYVGRFIVEELLVAGHAVTVMSRLPPAERFFSKPVRFQPLVLEPDAARPTLFEAADFFVHCAFDHVPGKYRGGEGDDPDGFRRRNLDGSVALFQVAKAAGVRRVIFLSSRAVYGTRPLGEWLDEADDPRPDTHYGQVKLEAERALNSLRGSGFDGTSLRATGVYGPAGLGLPHKWADLIADYLAGKEIEPRVATEVHGRDVAAAVQLVLEMAEPSAPVLNVSDIPVDRHDILATVKRETGSPHTLPARADAHSVNAMRTDRLKALGWKPGGVRLLEETIAELLRLS